MLNASRHHRPGSPSVPLHCHRCAQCSTPRGITAPGHCQGVELHRAVARGCSTPRGITAPGHALARGAPAAASTCSTPRGITAPGHVVPTDPAGRAVSCSTPRGITAPGHPAALTTRAPASTTCSTPRGITAPGHRASMRTHRVPRDVLNASRHHRPGSHWVTALDRRGWCRAQRLAASPPRVTSCTTPKTAAITWCSTPRGITAPGHRVDAQRPTREHDVLNASRHHRPGSPPRKTPS